MVEDSGKTPGAGAYQPVDLPEPVQVEADACGQPLALKMHRRMAVVDIEDRWRIDDEWWRKEPISRLYYAVRLKSGQRLVIYRDLAAGHWYKQSY